MKATSYKFSVFKVTIDTTDTAWTRPVDGIASAMGNNVETLSLADGLKTIIPIEIILWPL